MTELTARPRRKNGPGLLLSIALLLTLLHAPSVQAQDGRAVELELVLAVDTSLSINADEYAIQMGGLALSEAVKSKPEQTQSLFMTAFAVGAQVGALLPFSRTHESEADKMGLIFMAMAGYDPRAAPEFWQRMSASGGGAAPPELLSTHPSDDTRIRKLNEHMPEALSYYQP